MSETTLKTRVLHPYKTEAEWVETTETPKEGEVLYTSDSDKNGWFKIGDGVNDWSDLPYANYSPYRLMSRTWTDIICSANDATAYKAFFKIKRANYYTQWKLRVRVYSKVANQTEGSQRSELCFVGAKSVANWYYSFNAIENTSYRPVYGYLIYYATKDSFDSGYVPTIFGIRFQSSYSPTSSTYARTITIEILEAENCEIEFYDDPPYIATVENYNTTNYTTGTFDGTTQGVTITGDRNQTDRMNVYGSVFTAGTNGIMAYSLNMMRPNGTWESLTTTSGTGNKSRNTNGFRLGHLMYYAGSAMKAGGTASLGSMYSNFPSCDIRYSKMTNAQDLTIGLPVYVVGTYNKTDGLFYLAETWITQTLPTSDDEKVYILIGPATGKYTVTLQLEHPPIYCYKNGAIREFIPSASDNVNADWNATSGDAAILNKPSIPTKISDLTDDSDFVEETDMVEMTAAEFEALLTDE